MSPYRLLQEIYYPNAWKILVCCMLLNQTTGKQVHQIIKKLFKQYPNPKRMAMADPGDVCEIVKSCGLGNRRSVALIRMSQEYREKDWMEPDELFGVGQYAKDSYDIFILGKRVRPADKELKKYMRWKYGRHITPTGMAKKRSLNRTTP